MYGAVGGSSQRLIVSDDDEGLSRLLPQVEEELVELRLVLRVQAPRGFIGEDNSRVVDESTSYSDALFLTTRQFVGLVLGTVGEPHELQQFVGSLLGFLC